MTLSRRRTIVLTAFGLGAFLVLVVVALRWDEMLLWIRGWRIVWMPPGVLPSEGRDSILNSSGQVLVELSTDEGNPRAGRWSLATGEVVDFGTLPGDGDPRTLGFAINDLGHVTGTVYREGNHLARGFLWTEEKGMIELPGLGGMQISPTCIDGEDRIAGWAHPGPGAVRDRRPFLWSREGGTRDLGALPGNNSFDNDCAWTFLDAGRVLGESSGHIFLWSPDSGLRDLGIPPGGVSACPCATNRRGEVVCTVSTGQRRISPSVIASVNTPFLWTEVNGFAPLPAPPGFDHVWTIGITDEGDILLHATKFHGSEEPGKWVPTNYLLRRGMLEPLPVPPGWTSVAYLKLNARGWLVGIAERSGSGKPERRGFILKPAR